MGVSFDTPAENQAWAEREGFAFELWSDDNKDLALAYGAVTSRVSAFPARLTRILDAEGVLLVEYDEVAVGTHPAQVLEDCELLFGE